MSRSQRPLGQIFLALLAWALLAAPMAMAQTIIVTVIPPEPPRPAPPVIIPAPPRPRPDRAYVEAIELRSHVLDVKIDGQVATTRIEQTLISHAPHVVEASYLYPLPPDSRVDKFTLDINGKPTEAELLDADKARKLYEDIVRKTLDPGLLEYADRSVIRVRAFPMEPGVERKISLTYTSLLKSDAGLVTYSCPLRPRGFSTASVPKLAFKIDLTTKAPLKTVFSPTHNVEIKRDGNHHAVIGFEASGQIPDIDLQLLYSEEQPKAGPFAINLLSHHDGEPDGGHFLLLISPGQLIDPKLVIRKDITFVIDTSGSMSGEKMEQARKALLFCIEHLNEGDRFQVIRFSTDAEALTPTLVVATTGNRKQAKEFVAGFKAMGGTAIDSALCLAAKAKKDAKGDENRPWTVVFLTDGQPTVGPVDEATILKDFIAAGGFDEKGRVAPRVFSFGVGTDVNTHLLDKITERTRATSTYVLPTEDLELKLSNFYARVAAPVLANPELRFEGGVRISKVDPTAMPDIFQGDQLAVVGRFSGDGHASVTLSGFINGEKKSYTQEVKFEKTRKDNDFVPRLWALRRVGFLLDEIRLRGDNKELRDEVVELARRYGIVTPYTSYLILEDEARRNVPTALRTQSNLEREHGLKEDSRMAFNSLANDKSGQGAVEAARASGEMRQANQVAQESRTGNWVWGDNHAEFERRDGSAGSAPVASSPKPADGLAGSKVVSGPGGGGAFKGGLVRGGSSRNLSSVSGETAGGRARAAATSPAQQQANSRIARGKTFYQNGEVWVDAALQSQIKDGKLQTQVNKVKLASDDYFKLMRRNADVAGWLSVAQRVQVQIGAEVFEVVE